TKATTSKTTTTTVTTEKPHIASDDELCEWSMKNYNDEKGIMPDSAEISETADGKYQITLTDKSDNVLDVYLINPETGIGTDSSGNRVDLPKTGNNSLRNILTSVGALIMTASGFFAVKHSGTGRRKKDEQ
ncbi:MAG: LPXTG cell wall anchor domain-containing protein, partial [Ruminococcus sp.]|nr:LPXTG cell wall anchor domain-containing protein [Ruminococcus sp.]